MFKLNFFPVIILLNVLTACVDTSPDIPQGIIPRDSMVQLMADIHIAESRLIKAGSKTMQHDVKSTYMQQVLAKAEIDTSTFLKSFDFYSVHPELFSEMYEEVVVEISKRQAEVRKSKP